MGRRSDPDSWNWGWRRRHRFERLNERLERLPARLNSLRLRVRRSPNGLLLGVFRGIAESLGLCVFWTRVIGCCVLLALSGHGSLLVAGFFYLLAAVLMRGPEASTASVDPGGSRYPSNESRYPADEEDLEEERPSYSRRPRARPAAVPYQQVVHAPRVDFAALDRQVDALDRRIQRMEGIVTDRRYDWDRRMES
jgi:phage shock protein PspC (stress-responsive transcriptional regulator)